MQAEFGRLGDYFNGATHRDRTVYCSVVVKDNAAYALAILSELICDPKLAKDDLKLEQDIVEQESCNGCYNCTLREAQMAQTYPDQKMQHPQLRHFALDLSPIWRRGAQ